MRGLRDRVRCFIHGGHWPTDGEWKETVLRSFLRKNLPQPLEVGRGFIIGKERASTQIDVLIYDSSKPVLFRDGDLVFITPDAARGIIEVKSSLNNSTYRECVSKLTSTIEFIKFELRAYCFFGIFSFESSVDCDVALNQLQDSSRGDAKLIIRMVCLGDSDLILYWYHEPTHAGMGAARWHFYHTQDLAFGYFLHNCLEFASPRSTGENKELWFPSESKEIYKRGQIDLRRVSDSALTPSNPSN